jgi:two-component system, NtrC family, response regulator HydG
MQIASIAQQVLDGLLKQRAALAEMKVLIVEDDPNDVFLAKRPLEGAGLHVEVAPTAQEALNKLISDPQRQRYVMVFLDLKLPDRDGIYVLRHVRESNPDLPVIIMTGQNIDSELVQRAVELGYYGFIKKPIKNGAPEEIFAKHNLPLPKDVPVRSL